MLLTINISASETSTYCGAVRAELRAYAKSRAWRQGRRFVQIVSHDGQILDILEVTTRP